MKSLQCKSCGGTIKRDGNYYICPYCRSQWEDDNSTASATKLVLAWDALREGDFELSAERFENIISEEPKNHEAYWGKALAVSGIVYVTDRNEHKKVPTCHNITEKSFVESKDVKQAISLAPTDVAKNYRMRAEQIENIRVEWLEKASKEPKYDVFICYKDSDREHNIERTKDSVNAQDLYNALTAEGYRVFFSRISLRDKISEQYEPYIYNAIKTAQVMIVFGEKPEYFSAVWVKNEWRRFVTRIENGEKRENSLVVVYKDMNPGDLPTVLKSRQCLNYSDIHFLETLKDHIQKVMESSQQRGHLKRKTLKKGRFAKKSSTIQTTPLQIREIGGGTSVQTGIDEKELLDVTYTHIRADQWNDANRLVDGILSKNPSYAEAIWCKLLIEHRAKAYGDLIGQISSFSPKDFNNIEKVLTCANPAFATQILDQLYQFGTLILSKQGKERTSCEEAYGKILRVILPFNYANREKQIRDAFDIGIKLNHFPIFRQLLQALNRDDVDVYIQRNMEFASNTSNDAEKIACIQNVLNVDEGNAEAPV